MFAITTASLSSALVAMGLMLTAITTTVDSSPVAGDPDGTCSLCLADTTADSSGSEATVEIYFEDDGQDFDGDFTLTLTLDDQQVRTTSIDGASIDHEQTKRFTVADGSDWDWNDVESVVVIAVPD